MNKETISYVKHILGSDFVQIDFLNVCLALGIIATSFIALVGNNTSMFAVAFALGTILATFNMIKSIMKKSATGAITFGVLIPVLAGIVFFIYRYLA